MGGMTSDLQPIRETTQLVHDLQSAAIDLPRGRIRRGIQELTTRVARGELLTSAVDSKSCTLPDFYRQAILVSAKTGDLPLCLAEMARLHRALRDLRSNLMIPAVYAAAHVLLFLGAVMLFGNFIGTEFKQVLEDFDMAMPSMTLATLWLIDEGTTIIWKCLGLSLVLILVVRVFLGAAQWRLLMYSLPGAGPLCRWMGTWQLFNLLKLLLERSVPLDEALRAAAAGVSDANVAQVAKRLAERMAEGGSFASALEDTSRLARSTAPLIRWGEQNRQLSPALAQAADMLEGRMAMQSAWLRTVLPPIVTILIGAMAMAVGSVVLIPMISLIQNLS